MIVTPQMINDDEEFLFDDRRRVTLQFSPRKPTSVDPIVRRNSIAKLKGADAAAVTQSPFSDKENRSNENNLTPLEGLVKKRGHQRSATNIVFNSPEADAIGVTTLACTRGVEDKELLVNLVKTTVPAAAAKKHHRCHSVAVTNVQANEVKQKTAIPSIRLYNHKRIPSIRVPARLTMADVVVEEDMEGDDDDVVDRTSRAGLPVDAVVHITAPVSKEKIQRQKIEKVRNSLRDVFTSLDRIMKRREEEMVRRRQDAEGGGLNARNVIPGMNERANEPILSSFGDAYEEVCADRGEEMGEFFQDKAKEMNMIDTFGFDLSLHCGPIDDFTRFAKKKVDGYLCRHLFKKTMTVAWKTFINEHVPAYLSSSPSSSSLPFDPAVVPLLPFPPQSSLPFMDLICTHGVPADLRSALWSRWTGAEAVIPQMKLLVEKGMESCRVANMTMALSDGAMMGTDSLTEFLDDDRSDMSNGDAQEEEPDEDFCIDCVFSNTLLMDYATLTQMPFLNTNSTESFPHSPTSVIPSVSKFSFPGQFGKYKYLFNYGSVCTCCRKTEGSSSNSSSKSRSSRSRRKCKTVDCSPHGGAASSSSKDLPRSKEEMVRILQQIEKDLPRTCVNHQAFRIGASRHSDWEHSTGSNRNGSVSPDEEAPVAADGIGALRRLLTSFVWRNPSVGYLQSMNFIAAFFLIVSAFEEEKAFWMFVMFIENILPGHYCNKMGGLHLLLPAFSQGVLSAVCPTLFHLLDTKAIDVSFRTVSWFLAGFVTYLPTEAVAHVWDVLFAYTCAAPGPAGDERDESALVPSKSFFDATSLFSQGTLSSTTAASASSTSSSSSCLPSSPPAAVDRQTKAQAVLCSVTAALFENVLPLLNKETSSTASFSLASSDLIQQAASRMTSNTLLASLAFARKPSTCSSPASSSASASSTCLLPPTLSIEAVTQVLHAYKLNNSDFDPYAQAPRAPATTAPPAPIAAAAAVAAGSSTSAAAPSLWSRLFGPSPAAAVDRPTLSKSLGNKRKAPASIDTVPRQNHEKANDGSTNSDSDDGEMFDDWRSTKRVKKVGEVVGSALLSSRRHSMTTRSGAAWTPAVLPATTALEMKTYWESAPADIAFSH